MGEKFLCGNSATFEQSFNMPKKTQLKFAMNSMEQNSAIHMRKQHAKTGSELLITNSLRKATPGLDKNLLR